MIIICALKVSKAVVSSLIALKHNFQILFTTFFQRACLAYPMQKMRNVSNKITSLKFEALV